MWYLVQFFIRLLVDLHRRHRLLHVTEDHVQVLIVSLGQTHHRTCELGEKPTRDCNATAEKTVRLPLL